MSMVTINQAIHKMVNEMDLSLVLPELVAMAKQQLLVVFSTITKRNQTASLIPSMVIYPLIVGFRTNHEATLSRYRSTGIT